MKRWNPYVKPFVEQVQQKIYSGKISLDSKQALPHINSYNAKRDGNRLDLSA